jgi:hypothetical protein
MQNRPVTTASPEFLSCSQETVERPPFVRFERQGLLPMQCKKSSRGYTTPALSQDGLTIMFSSVNEGCAHPVLPLPGWEKTANRGQPCMPHLNGCQGHVQGA